MQWFVKEQVEEVATIRPAGDRLPQPRRARGHRGVRRPRAGRRRRRRHCAETGRFLTALPAVDSVRHSTRCHRRWQPILGVGVVDPSSVRAGPSGDTEPTTAPWYEIFQDSPRVLHSGDWAALREAAESMTDDQGRIPAAVAWRAAAIHHQAGRFMRRSIHSRLDRRREPPMSPGSGRPRAALGRQKSAPRPGRRRTPPWLRHSARATTPRSSRLRRAGPGLRRGGDRDQNRRCYDLAMERAVAAGDVVTQVRVLNNLGSSEIEQGRYAHALEYLDDSLGRCDDLGPVPLGAALARLNRGEALLGLGRVDEALAELELARAMYREMDAPFLSQVLLDDRRHQPDPRQRRPGHRGLPRGRRPGQRDPERTGAGARAGRTGPDHVPGRSGRGS